MIEQYIEYMNIKQYIRFYSIIDTHLLADNIN